MLGLAVDEIVKTGVRLTNVTCDCLRAQISMMKVLGASLDPDNLDLKICCDKQTTPIYFMHDMCHCIKLVRNAWHFHKCMKNSKGELIEWSYIEKL